MAIALTTVSYIKKVRLASRRHQQTCVFIYKALLSKFLSYSASLIEVRDNNHYVRSQNRLALKILHTNSKVGKTGFQYYEPHYYNELQNNFNDLKAQVNEIEQYLRVNNIEFVGLPVPNPGESEETLLY